MRKIKIKIRELLDKITPYVTKITQDRNKLILTGIVILIILYLDFSFVLKSQRRAIRAVNSNIVRLRKGLENLETDLNRMKRQEAGLSVGQEKRLVSTGQMPWVIEEISRLANQQGVRIFQVRPVREVSAKKVSGKSIGADQYLSILINLELSAGYHQLGRFLAGLENHSIFLQVHELDISRNEKNPFEHEINLVLKTYVSE